MKKIFSLLILTLLCFTLASCNNARLVKVIDIKLTEEDYAFAIKKNNTALKDDFNLFLTEIKENGEFEAIVRKYFEDGSIKKGYEVSSNSIVNDEKNFIVATNCPFEPFEYVASDGLIYGIDIEIASLYASKRNLNLYIKNIDFDAILNDVDAGFSDIGMAGMTITTERLEVCDFTIPYYKASQKLVVEENNQAFKNCVTTSDVEEVLNSLNKEKIGYQNGTNGNWYVVGDDDLGFKGFKNLTPVGYKTAQLAIQDVANGLIYGVIVDEAPALSMTNSINMTNNKLETFTDAISEEAFQKLILTGLKNTALIAIFGLLIGILIGTIIAIIKVAPKYKLVVRIFDKISTVYVAIFRGTPMVVQLLLAYYVFIPMLGIKGVEALSVAIVVFGLNSAAYVSEIMRGGLNSVDKGQLEAGRALGLSYPVTMIKIVIPQAIKNILPTLGNEFITLIKETSVVSFVTVVDLYTAFNTIGLNTYSVIIPYLVMALIYIILVIAITILIKLIERGLARSDRRN